MAFPSLSSVLMRTTPSTGNTKILTSPISPVLAFLTIASTTLETSSSRTTSSSFSFGIKSTPYFPARHYSGIFFCIPLYLLILFSHFISSKECGNRLPYTHYIILILPLSIHLTAYSGILSVSRKVYHSPFSAIISQLFVFTHVCRIFKKSFTADVESSIAFFPVFLIDFTVAELHIKNVNN